MDFDTEMNRARLEHKFGRGASTRLSAMWATFRGTEREKVILRLYMQDLGNTRNYREAIPVLQRLLELDIDGQTRDEAATFLQLSEAKERLMPSEPDASNPEFVDFMAVLRKGDFFKPVRSFPATSEHFPVRRLQSAKRLAWHQGIGAPYQSWNHLRSMAAAEVYGHYSDNKITDGALNAATDEITEICEASLSDVMMHFFDDIIGDLGEIARGKLVGVVPDLHARMWEAYQARTYPCGWRGDYPAGKLCVFPNR